MTIRPHFQQGFCVLLVIVSFCFGEARADGAYTFGVVPQFTAKQVHATWRPILDELERRTGLRFELMGSASIPLFERQFMQGRFDFAYMNPYHIGLGHSSQGYAPLVRDIDERLHGIVVVKADSSIQDVTELEGKTVAFPAPNALGASLLVRADFHDIFHLSIAPRYVRSHASVYLNVLLGQAVAGGGVQKTLGRQPAPIKDALRVIYRTRDFPPHPVAAHARVPDTVREKVTRALLAMDGDEEGRALLAKVPIKRLGRSVMEEYLPLQEMGLERFYGEEN